MSKYIIVPPKLPQSGFLINIIGTDGSRHTMLGFESEEQAHAWIDADRRRDARTGEVAD